MSDRHTHRCPYCEEAKPCFRTWDECFAPRSGMTCNECESLVAEAADAGLEGDELQDWVRSQLDTAA